MIKGKAFIESDGTVVQSDINALIRGYDMTLNISREDMDTIFKSISKDKFGQITAENFIKDFEQTVERRRPDYIQGQAEDYVEDHLPG